MSLLAFALRRLLWTVPLLLLVMLATYALMRGMGGDPFVLPEGSSGLPLPLERELREYYHLDDPWLVEFGHYVTNAAQFDFRPSLNRRGVSVDAVVEQSLPVTGLLVLLAALVAVPAGFVLGLLGALKRARRSTPPPRPSRPSSPFCPSSSSPGCSRATRRCSGTGCRSAGTSGRRGSCPC